MHGSFTSAPRRIARTYNDIVRKALAQAIGIDSSRLDVHQGRHILLSPNAACGSVPKEMRTLRTATLVLGGLAAAFVACGEKPVRTPMQSTEVAIPTAIPSASPIESASTMSAPPADSAATPARIDAPSHDAPRAPGEIACGRASCKVGKERCCASMGTCVAVGDESAAAYCQWGHEYRCDSRDDCTAGESCCYLYGDPANVTMCMTRCPENQACHGQTGCPTDFVCKRDRSTNEPGTCVFAKPTTQCGKTTCSGAKPVCRWNPSTTSGKCVDSIQSEPTDDEHDIKCSSRADCGGESCCMSAGRTWCGACVNNNVVCKTKTDCPPQFGGGQKLKGCVATGRADWASWLKYCEYDDP